MGDMMIPFIMLLILTIALVLERKFHEEKIVNIYETKFNEWKEHSSDKKEKVANASSHIKAREIISTFTTKDSSKYDNEYGISTFYISQEVK